MEASATDLKQYVWEECYISFHNDVSTSFVKINEVEKSVLAVEPSRIRFVLGQRYRV